MKPDTKDTGTSLDDELVARNFVLRTTNEVERVIKHVDGDILALDARFKELEATMQGRVNSLAGLEERRKEIRKGEDFGAEYDALLKNAKISMIEVYDNHLTVVTTELCILYHKRRYYFDPLKIEIYFDMSEVPAARRHPAYSAGDFAPISVWPSHPHQKVSALGYGHEGRNWPAPHVRGDGSICLGNIEDAVKSAWRAQEWTLVVDLMIPFLESCNGGSYFHILEAVATRIEDETPHNTGRPSRIPQDIFDDEK